MKKLSFYSMLLLMNLVLWGCPYRSEVALGDATEAVNKQMLGKWITEVTQENENPEYYVIGERDPFHYDIDHFQYSDEQKEYTVKQYVGHTTQLDTFLFMNLQESGQRDFLLYRLSLKGNEMVMFEVTDNIEERFTEAAAMREFFNNYKHLSFFYNSEKVRLLREVK